MVNTTASTIYVNVNTGSDTNNGSTTAPKKTIKAGISSVSSGGTINVANGTYKESGLAITKSMTINGGGEWTTVINGSNKGNVITIAKGINVTISNLAITYGNASYGGGLVNDGSTTLTNVAVTHCTSPDYAGGIWNAGTLIGNNVAFSVNQANWGGGMASNYGASTILSNCQFTNNVATSPVDNQPSNAKVSRSGGFFCLGPATITNCVFSGNKAFESVALANYGHYTVTVTNSTFTNNSALSSAGAIGNYHSLTIINGCTFTGNYAGNTGGAIYNDGQDSTATLISQYQITNSTFTDNSAKNDGGALSTYDGPATITNCVFTNNSAPNGGALFNYKGTLHLSGDTYSGISTPYVVQYYS